MSTNTKSIQTTTILNDTTSFDKTPLSCPLHDILPLGFELVTGTKKQFLWNHVIDSYHYLGHKRIHGKRLKYLVYSKNKQIIAAIGWKSGSRYLKARDKFIGWSPGCRDQSLDHIATNIRFLILPWIHVFNLGSYILAHNLKTLKMDWYNRYGKELYLVETFIDPGRHTGSCYRAANWQLLGTTKGFSKIRGGYIYHGRKKEVYVYVIRKDFRNRLGCTTPWKPSTPVPKPRNWMEEVRTMIFQKLDFNPELLDKHILSQKLIDDIAEELCRFHTLLCPAFSRTKQIEHSTMYLKGLLSSLERKHMEGIALNFSGPDAVRGLQKFMKDSPWDDKLMHDIYLQELGNDISDEDGMFTIDSSENLKKGTESVGVSNQYCGNTGKTDNCQSGVFLGYASQKGYGLLDRRLYMPKKWFDDNYAERRMLCKVPQDLRFQTKLEIAIDLLTKVTQQGTFSGKWVGCDSFYGRSQELCDKVEALGYWYFASIKPNQLFWLERPEVIPIHYTGRGRPPREHAQRATSKPLSVANIARREDIEWKTVVLAEGAKGPIVADIAIMRIIRHSGSLPDKEVWLFIRKDEDGRLHYYISNAPENISHKELIRIATMRWSIEQCFEDGKKYLGMDHYEHRSWPAWNRHMLFVFIAMYFLLRMRIKYKKNSSEYSPPNSITIEGNLSYK